MKKVFRLEELDCAHCAQKIEDGIRAIDGVQAASVNFFTQKLTIEAADADFDGVLKKAVKVARKIEPDCVIVI